MYSSTLTICTLYHKINALTSTKDSLHFKHSCIYSNSLLLGSFHQTRKHLNPISDSRSDQLPPHNRAENSLSPPHPNVTIDFPTARRPAIFNTSGTFQVITEATTITRVAAVAAATAAAATATTTSTARTRWTAAAAATRPAVAAAPSGPRRNNRSPLTACPSTETPRCSLCVCVSVCLCVCLYASARVREYELSSGWLPLWLCLSVSLPSSLLGRSRINVRSSGDGVESPRYRGCERERVREVWSGGWMCLTARLIFF